MIGLDTNVLLRYIAQDDPVQSPLATTLIEETCTADAPGFVTLVSLVELIWISKRRFSASRNEMSNIVRRLLSIRQLVVQETEIVSRALTLFETTKMEFADCLLLQLAMISGCNAVMTFDQTAAKAGMTLLK